MSHDLCADLDELVLRRRQGPAFDSLGQGQRPQEVAEILGQRIELVEFQLEAAVEIDPKIGLSEITRQVRRVWHAALIVLH